MLRLLLLPVLFLLGNNTPANATPPLKIITVIVDQHRGITIGRDTVDTETLPDILSERLWKSYLGTGKMYDSIHVVFNGEILMGTRGAILDAIQAAQEKTRKRLCLQKYKQLYESLTPAQQQRLKLKFRVLFQEVFV